MIPAPQKMIPAPRQDDALPDRDDDHISAEDYDVSPERARELARDHDRPAADRFRELQDLGGEPDHRQLEDAQIERLAELRDREPTRTRLLRQLAWVAIAFLAIIAVSFLGGLWFGSSDEPRAARTLLGDRVEPQPEVTDGIAEGPAPTSGVTDLDPLCGIVSEPVPPERQVATIMEGGVIVQYQPSAIDDAAIEELEDWATNYVSHLLVAPNPAIDAPIVATAFRNRMPLEEVDTDVLSSFATGYGDAQGPMGRCPITG